AVELGDTPGRQERGAVSIELAGGGEERDGERLVGFAVDVALVVERGLLLQRAVGQRGVDGVALRVVGRRGGERRAVEQRVVHAGQVGDEEVRRRRRVRVQLRVAAVGQL